MRIPKLSNYLFGITVLLLSGFVQAQYSAIPDILPGQAPEGELTRCENYNQAVARWQPGPDAEPRNKSYIRVLQKTDYYDTWCDIAGEEVAVVEAVSQDSSLPVFTEFLTEPTGNIPNKEDDAVIIIEYGNRYGTFNSVQTAQDNEERSISRGKNISNATTSFTLIDDPDRESPGETTEKYFDALVDGIGQSGVFFGNLIQNAQVDTAPLIFHSQPGPQPEPGLFERLRLVPKAYAQEETEELDAAAPGFYIYNHHVEITPGKFWALPEVVNVVDGAIVTFGLEVFCESESKFVFSQEAGSSVLKNGCVSTGAGEVEDACDWNISPCTFYLRYRTAPDWLEPDRWLSFVIDVNGNLGNVAYGGSDFVGGDETAPYILGVVRGEPFVSPIETPPGLIEWFVYFSEPVSRPRLTWDYRVSAPAECIQLAADGVDPTAVGSYVRSLEEGPRAATQTTTGRQSVWRIVVFGTGWTTHPETCAGAYGFTFTQQNNDITDAAGNRLYLGETFPGNNLNVAPYEDVIGLPVLYENRWSIGARPPKIMRVERLGPAVVGLDPDDYGRPTWRVFFNRPVIDVDRDDFEVDFGAVSYTLTTVEPVDVASIGLQAWRQGAVYDVSLYTSWATEPEELAARRWNTEEVGITLTEFYTIRSADIARERLDTAGEIDFKPITLDFTPPQGNALGLSTLDPGAGNSLCFRQSWTETVVDGSPLGPRSWILRATDVNGNVLDDHPLIPYRGERIDDPENGLWTSELCARAEGWNLQDLEGFVELHLSEENPLTDLAGNPFSFDVSQYFDRAAFDGRGISETVTVSLRGVGRRDGQISYETDAGAQVCTYDFPRSSGACSVEVGFGEELKLTATGDSGFFAGWIGCDQVAGDAGDECIITPYGNREVGAAFTDTAGGYLLSVVPTGNDDIAVSMWNNPSPVIGTPWRCSTEEGGEIVSLCSAVIEPDTVVELSVADVSGAHTNLFRYWRGCDALEDQQFGRPPRCLVTMDSAKEILVRADMPHTRRAEVNTPGEGSIEVGFETDDYTCTYSQAPVLTAQEAVLGFPSDRFLVHEGIVDFEISDCENGATVDVRFDYDTAAPENSIVISAEPWQETDGFVNGTVLDVRMTDGGPNDADGVENGVIVASLAVAVPLERAMTLENPEGDPVDISFSTEDPGCSFESGRVLEDLGVTYGFPLWGFTPQKAGVAFDIGGCTSGASVRVRVDYGSDLPERTVILKSGPWRVIAASISGSVIEYDIVDGGLNDADGEVNGVLVDPIVAALPLSDAVPTAVGVPIGSQPSTQAIPTLQQYFLFVTVVALILSAGAGLRRKGC